MYWFKMITLAFQVRHAVIAAASASVCPSPPGQRRNAAVKQNGLFSSAQYPVTSSGLKSQASTPDPLPRW